MIKTTSFKCILTVTICFLMSSCLQWAARAENKLPKETALQKKYDFDGKVIIVGAGASGLAAAKILEKNQIDYTILEATNRYGGRLKKDTTLADFSIDVGAEWIHSNPKVLNVIKGVDGSKIEEELIDYKLESGAKWNGKKIKPVTKNYLNVIYNFMPESKFKNSTWYDFVNQNLAKGVIHNIVYNSKVKTIDFSGDKISITTEKGEKYYADKVLVTVSIGVLKSNSIRFSPDLSAKKKKAIHSITFNTGFKMAIKFSEKFYPDAIQCKAKNGEKSYYDMAFKKDTKEHILGFLCTGVESKNYDALLTEQDIVNNLIEELDDMFEGKASQTYLHEYRYENWGQHEFTKGTWTQAFMERKSALKELNQPLNKKIYFAGEIYDIYHQMGVPGAILSGYDAVDLMLNKTPH